MSDKRFSELIRQRRETLVQAKESADLEALDEHLKVLHQLAELAEAQLKKPKP